MNRLEQLILCLILIVPGCSNSVPQTETKVNIHLCPPTKILGPIDEAQLTRLREGCVRVYGPGSCLVRVESYPKRQHYNAICRRADTGTLGRVN